MALDPHHNRVPENDPSGDRSESDFRFFDVYSLPDPQFEKQLDEAEDFLVAHGIEPEIRLEPGVRTGFLSDRYMMFHFRAADDLSAEQIKSVQKQAIEFDLNARIVDGQSAKYWEITTRDLEFSPMLVARAIYHLKSESL